jgi:hypothetical protein
VFEKIEVLELTGKLSFILFSVKIGNWSSATFTNNKTFPKFGNVIAYWRQNPDSGDYYSAQFHALQL